MNQIKSKSERAERCDGLANLRFRSPTSCLLHGQLVTDLLLVVGQVLEGLLVQTCFPQHLVLVEQQLAVLVIHFVRRRLSGQRQKVGVVKVLLRGTL